MAVVKARAPLGQLETEHHELLTDVEVRTRRARAARADALRKRGEIVYREKRTAHVRAEMAQGKALRGHSARFHSTNIPKLPPLERGSSRHSTLQMPQFEPNPQGGAPVNRWHAKRASGLEARFQRMRECHLSNDYLVRECGCSAQRFRLGCGQRNCNRCRKARISALQKPFLRARGRLIEEARVRRLRMRERMFTLTAPHIGTAEQRVELLYRAWKGTGKHSFAEEVRRIAAESAGPQWAKAADLTHLFRVFEWTEGLDDGQGHPHFHCWHFGHYMPQEALADAWTRRIEAAAESMGLALPSDWQGAIVDVRKAREGIEHELIKYLVKDLSDLPGKRGEFVDGQVMADVLIALEGRRTRQTSRDFALWAVKYAAQHWCQECGTRYVYAHMGGELSPHPCASLEGLPQIAGPPLPAPPPAPVRQLLVRRR